MITCCWCHHGRKIEVQATHVMLFACIREHFEARPICGICAIEAEAAMRDRRPYYCRDCSVAAGTANVTALRIVLVCSRPEWMAKLDAGEVRFAGMPR